MNSEQLTTLRNQMTEKWFSSLKVGDKVYNYSLKWQNKQIIDKKLRDNSGRNGLDSGENLYIRRNFRTSTLL